MSLASVMLASPMSISIKPSTRTTRPRSVTQEPPCHVTHAPWTFLGHTRRHRYTRSCTAASAAACHRQVSNHIPVVMKTTFTESIIGLGQHEPSPRLYQIHLLISQKSLDIQVLKTLTHDQQNKLMMTMTMKRKQHNSKTHRSKQGWNCRGRVNGFDPQLSFQPPYSLLFFTCHDFRRALLTLPVIFVGIPTPGLSELHPHKGAKVVGFLTFV